MKALAILATLFAVVPSVFAANSCSETEQKVMEIAGRDAGFTRQGVGFKDANLSVLQEKSSKMLKGAEKIVEQKNRLDILSDDELLAKAKGKWARQYRNILANANGRYSREAIEYRYKIQQILSKKSQDWKEKHQALAIRIAAVESNQLTYDRIDFHSSQKDATQESLLASYYDSKQLSGIEVRARDRNPWPSIGGISERSDLNYILVFENCKIKSIRFTPFTLDTEVGFSVRSSVCKSPHFKLNVENMVPPLKKSLDRYEANRKQVEEKKMSEQAEQDAFEDIFKQYETDLRVNYRKLVAEGKDPVAYLRSVGLSKAHAPEIATLNDICTRYSEFLSDDAPVNEVPTSKSSAPVAK